MFSAAEVSFGERFIYYVVKFGSKYETMAMDTSAGAEKPSWYASGTKMYGPFSSFEEAEAKKTDILTPKPKVVATPAPVAAPAIPTVVIKSKKDLNWSKIIGFASITLLLGAGGYYLYQNYKRTGKFTFARG